MVMSLASWIFTVPSLEELDAGGVESMRRVMLRRLQPTEQRAGNLVARATVEKQ
jgi:hypothetical protein